MKQKCRSAGTATITQVAQHWNVYRETAMGLLEIRGVPLIDDDGPLQVEWADVWSVEGAGFVAANNFRAFQEPLLRIDRLGIAPDNCRRPDTYMSRVELKPSALRARVAQIREPIIRLSDRVKRVRPCDLEALLKQLRT